MNISQIEKNMCCGCTACLAVCPKDAIHMEQDEEGFIYPVVNEHLCIQCGLCEKICTRKSSLTKDVTGAFAAKNTNQKVIRQSSSGGISHALCHEIIDQGGVVYGVAFTEDYKVITKRAESIDECDSFYGSKYVQTNPCNTFKQVKEDLDNGLSVLYFGTSCHIAGLISYLNLVKANTKKLYTVDLICHGVPSPKVFDSYISWIKDEMKMFEFRTKHKPWGYGSKNYGCTITTVDGKKHVDTLKSRVFLNIFFSNNCLRPYCHNCEFAGINKPADITIADFWGCDKEHPEFFSEKGVSAVLVHSEKGEQLIENASELSYIKSTVDRISKKQGNLYRPSPMNNQRKDFWLDFNSKDFNYIAKKYGNYNLKGFIHNTGLYKKYAEIRNSGKR